MDAIASDANAIAARMLLVEDMGSIKEEIKAVNKEIDGIDTKIEEVKETIKGVQKELDLEASKSHLSKEAKGRLLKKEEYLLQEKNELVEEKKQLVEKKKQLRDLLLEKEKQMLVKEQRLRLDKEWQLRLTSIRGQRQQQESTTKRALEALMEEVQKMRAVLIKRDRATPKKSPATLGCSEYQRLDNLRKVTMLDSASAMDKGEAFVLSAKEQAILDKLQSEPEVIAFLTPFLEEVFVEKPEQSTVWLVNSEQYKWLKISDNPKYSQKPDLFLCHKTLVATKDPFKTKDPKVLGLRKTTSIYGVLANWRTRRFLSLVCEAKLKISNEALGEIINYGAHICFEEDGPEVVRLLLFDKTEFWLVEVVKGIANSIHKCKWTQPGSRAVLREFPLPNPLIEALDLACQHYGLNVEPDSFLGEGAFGIVFRVYDKNQRVLALKIVPYTNTHLTELQKQKELTEQAYSKCPNVVVGIEPDGHKEFEGKGAVLLQSEAGDHYSNLQRDQIVEALRVLHSKSIQHGDARVENVVSVQGTPKWIDFREAFLFSNSNSSQVLNREMDGLMESLDRVFSDQI